LLFSKFAVWYSFRSFDTWTDRWKQGKRVLQIVCTVDTVDGKSCHVGKSATASIHWRHSDLQNLEKTHFQGNTWRFAVSVSRHILRISRYASLRLCGIRNVPASFCRGSSSLVSRLLVAHTNRMDPCILAVLWFPRVHLRVHPHSASFSTQPVSFSWYGS